MSLDLHIPKRLCTFVRENQPDTIPMDKEEIKKLIPHREPMLLVDEADLNGNEAIAQYTIPEDAFYVQGHFPGNPIVPGVILCEIMAQGSALLMKDYLHDKLALYAKLEDVRFKRQVRPGDTVVTHSHIAGKKGPLVIVQAEAFVNDALCCKGTLSFMLTLKP